MHRISPRFRIGLFGKGLLLFSLGLVFAALTQRGVLGGEWNVLLRALAAVVFGVPTLFLGWTALLAFADAVIGQAVAIDGAVALQPRRLSGVSFRLPKGGTAEFLLYNAGQPLAPGAKYALIIGRWSHVLVEAPRAQ